MHKSVTLRAGRQMQSMLSRTRFRSFSLERHSVTLALVHSRARTVSCVFCCAENVIKPNIFLLYGNSL